jgi:hypothetical protein
MKRKQQQMSPVKDICLSEEQELLPCIFFVRPHHQFITLRTAFVSITWIFLLFTLVVHSQADEIISLITQDEADLPRLKAHMPPLPTSTGQSPKITIIQPQSSAIQSTPFAVKVTFGG